MSNVIVFGDTGTNFRAIGCDINGNMNVNVVSGGSSNEIIGSTNNIMNNGNINPGSSTYPYFNINNQYGNESVISYRDSSTTNTDYIPIFGAIIDNNPFFIGVIQPIVLDGYRYGSLSLKLRGLKYITLRNISQTDTLVNVYITLYSG